MAKRTKTAEVQKFGGVEKVGNVRMETAVDPFNGSVHELSSIETQSKITLEQDKGEGDMIFIRCFTFAFNPEVMKQMQTEGRILQKQDLFNAHHKGIELALWKDGLKADIDLPIRVVVNDKNYQIFVSARPRKGWAVDQKPLTLSEIAHGRLPN